jgi:hypothetical protein
MKIQIQTSVDSGRFKRNRNLILKAINSYEGKDVLITFEKPKKHRSNNQNAYYWGVVLSIIQTGLLDATGELRNVNDIHYNILLPMFAPINDITNLDTGEIVSERITSSEMTTTQFMEFILDIQKWAAEFLSVDIPNPNEQNMLNL